MNDIAMMGPQGAGKGTQSAFLSARTGLPHISLGALFRMEMAAGTDLGKELAQYVERGEIAPGDLAMRVLAERLSRPDAAAGVILDGFPRTVEQAQMCDAMLMKLGRGIAHAVLLQITDDESRDRLSKRIVCVDHSCGENYHLVAKPPRIEGVCDLCGARLEARADDVPEVVTRRLAIYHSETKPVAERYRMSGVLREVDGAQPIENVFIDVLKAIGAHSSFIAVIPHPFVIPAKAGIHQETSMSLTATDFDCVIGLIGHKASGKDVFSRAMAAKGFAEWRVSDPIRAEAVKRRVAIGLGPENMNKYTIKELMDIGDEFRLKGGPGYPAQLMLEMAKHKGDRKVVVNGVRNPGEIIKMREIAGDKLVLVGTTAPIMTRFSRASARHQPEDPLTLDQFLQNDDRDRGIGQPDHGQQVDRCLAQVPHDNIYCNQGTLATYHAWIDHFSTRHGL